MAVVSVSVTASTDVASVTGVPNVGQRIASLEGLVGTGSVVAVPNGSASAPGVAFASDPDSGMYRLGANRIGLATNGVVAMYVNSDGAIIVPDAANGDPLSLGSGTAAGSIVTGYNRAYRTINAAQNGTVRLLIANSQDEIAIGSDGAEGGPDASIVIRAATTQFMRGGVQRLGVTTSGADVTGALTVSTTLGVTGAATLSSTLGVTGAATFSSTIASGAITSTSAVIGASGQASGSTAFQARVSGDANFRIEIRNNGTIVFGDGAGNNASLASPGASLLRTPGKMLATSGIGVGNSASASAVGTLSKKMQVFDETGASIGYVPIYTTIT